MIGYLKGKIKYLAPDYVLLDVNGVGYEVVCSGLAFSSLNGREKGELYTYLQVKEDGVTLYGFATLKEKDLFLKLTSVSGVGAKMAIGILSGMRPDDVSEAIASADVKRLCSVKGLGKKTAERIVLELHGKISADEILGVAGERVVAAASPREDDDALSALMNLGYTKAESAEAVRRAKAAGAVTLEEIIGTALRSMGR